MPPENSVRSTHPPLVSGRLAVWEWIALLTLFCLPPLVGMARHPLWIDETLTLFPVPSETTSLRAFVGEFLQFPGSLRYTPLYALLVAAWARITIPSELGLRCVNLPFLVGIALLSRAYIWRLPLRSSAARWGALCFVALSPFYLHYSYDLRPYAALTCFGGMMLVGLLLCTEWNPRGPWLVSAGFCLAFLTQPPVILLAPLLGLVVIILGRRDIRRSMRDWVAPGVVGSVISAGGAYYYHLVRSGGGMESWGGGGFAKNLAFIAYEFAGFSGLGPTRSQLRTLAPPSGFASSVEVVHLSAVDWLPAAFFAVIWLAALFLAAKSMRVKPVWSVPSVRLSAFLFFGGMLFLGVFFYLIHYRFLARHVSFLYLPFLFWFMAVAAQVEWRRPARVIFALLLLGFAASSAQLLFNPAHLRENPRGFRQAWQSALRRDASVKLWAIYPIHSVLFYLQDRDVLWVGSGAVGVSRRTGPASYQQDMIDADRADFGGASVVCLQVPSRAIWEKLLASNRGRRVILAINRGTEFDPEGFAQKLIADPAAQAKKLGAWPFVECYEVLIP